MDDTSPSTVFICNTSLHIMNAMDACVAFNIDPASAWLVVKTVPAAPPNSIKPVIDLAPWGRVIWVGDLPVEGRGIFSFFKFQLAIYKYYRGWQKQLAKAKGVSRVFVSFNRMIANRIIANWLSAREIVWLDDGTLSYALALDSVLPPAKKKAVSTSKTISAVGAKRKSAKSVAGKVKAVRGGKKKDSVSAKGSVASKKVGVSKKVVSPGRSGVAKRSTISNKSVGKNATTGVVKRTGSGKGAKAAPKGRPGMARKTTQLKRKAVVTKRAGTNNRKGRFDKVKKGSS
ncbi:hypothetical protein [Pseudomonas sp. NCCP-436]|uniref:hypothetical protein n=1 Tax=Pseudomonas sp. NCCP-436 TaxID=2842481 RepID=UPI001C7FA7F2|nr:hypothetical protein [Pseudomonas sp. NCCP-436]GIZ11943.1 hypothetical protein NCCP436_13590 [Pseudomonas sp. NCCP-436]